MALSLCSSDPGRYEQHYALPIGRKKNQQRKEVTGPSQFVGTIACNCALWHGQIRKCLPLCRMKKIW